MFDSGLGGLTVLNALRARSPLLDAIFIADQAHVPYGGRPLSEIFSFASALTDYCFADGASAVVMACNISSATALVAARTRHRPDRVFGMIEPGARAGLALSKSRAVGVLATAGTVASGAYTKTIKALDAAATVVEVACPSFVPLVEAGAFETTEALAAAELRVQPLLDAGCDVAILGCTHYPFLLPVLERASGGRLQFVDPAAQLAGELPTTVGSGRTELMTTGDLRAFRRQLVGLGGYESAIVSGVSWHDGALLPSETAR